MTRRGMHREEFVCHEEQESAKSLPKFNMSLPRRQDDGTDDCAISYTLVFQKGQQTLNYFSMPVPVSMPLPVSMQVTGCFTGIWSADPGAWLGAQPGAPPLLASLRCSCTSHVHVPSFRPLPRIQAVADCAPKWGESLVGQLIDHFARSDAQRTCVWRSLCDWWGALCYEALDHVDSMMAGAA